ncbi:diaminobutyrate--2-oxoglutarate transaminase [Haladaptatus sp. CMSO5]|uniref:diaminobutyrate--2-oxoglutarate transaminase n=1 Tax=Haladaptatus sp. CMSO5 TaxID=3120514 RepID=UPI002FCE4A38
MTYADRSNSALLGQQQRRESNARSYPRSLKFAIKRARGAVIEDMDGNEYLDCLAGAGTLALGHNHPVVTEAIEAHLARDSPMHTLDVTTPAKERFADSLYDSLPSEFASRAKVQFCSPAGTDAIEASMKLVKTATGNEGMLSFQGGYHGMSQGALSLTGDRGAKDDVGGLLPYVHHLPFPANYRPPFGLGGETEWRANADYLENLLADPKSGLTEPAGMFLEVVQGEAGSRPAPHEWVREVRRLTREHNIPLIVDEIQTGLGRTGSMFAFEAADITPDVVTLSKAIGGGLPIAVVCYDESLDQWEPGAHAGTFRGNQLAMAAGSATIDYILDNDLDDHAARMGSRLHDALSDLLRYDCVGDVRGRGLMLGVEFVEPDESGGPHPPDGDLAAAVQQACLDRGLVIETGGINSATARFLPPLIVTRGQVDEIAARFTEAVHAVIEEQEAAA